MFFLKIGLMAYAFASFFFIEAPAKKVEEKKKRKQIKRKRGIQQNFKNTFFSYLLVEAPLVKEKIIKTR